MNGEDGKSDLRGAQWKNEEFMVAQIDEDELEENKKAADACPVNIIRVSE